MTTPVVFLHGAGMGGWMWRPQIAALPQFRCLAPDLPAHGSNASLPWVSIRDSAQWVAEYIRREAGGRAHIVGLSLGAVVGYELLAAFPESVDRLVLSGGMGLGRPGKTMTGRFTRATMGLASSRLFVRATLAAMRVPAEDRDMGVRDMTRISPTTLSDMVDQVMAYHVDDSLRNRPHRVLAIAGSFEAPSIKHTVRHLAEIMPNAKAVIVPKGLHTWNWQFPELFTQTVADFLSRDS
jgi:pimeloyl-ACP methyl ester carboxylesterase